MNKVRLALMMLILLGSIFASKNLMTIADASKQVENRKLNPIRNQTASNPPVLLGLYTPDYMGNQSTIDNQLYQVDQWVGKRHSIAGLFFDIEDSNPAYNIPVSLEQLKQNGYTAFINLKSTRSAAQIARGDIDSSLQKVAKAYSDWAKQGDNRIAFIAPLQEMNIPGETYSKYLQNFKLAYQRIQKIFKEAGVSSQAIRWVFAPNGWSEDNEHRFENYYPGDKSVDVVAFSAYNWGYCSNSSWEHWSSPKEVFESYIKRMKVMAGSKPIFIAQTASTSNTQNSLPNTAKDQWLQEADKVAAKRAWKYFERNWNPQTGLVNSVDNLPWTTWWDQGSALLGIHAAYQLGLLPQDVFQKRMNTLLQTLEKLPLPATGLPNKAYSTHTAEMRRLNDTPDPKGTSGWSALDMARFLLALHIIRSHYPEYSDSPKGDSFASRINRIVDRWHTSKLVKDGWLNGAIPRAGKLLEVQEGRLGYEQYAAHSLKLWNIQASNALSNPPIKTVEIDGIKLQIDQRNFKNSGATNYLTNDPYLLWGLEMGWNDAVKPQMQNLFKLQQQRFKRTGILTAVNEDSLDRSPYFLYYSVYFNGQSWQAVNITGKAYPQLRFVSTKAAFSWFALMPDDAYTKKLRDFAQNLSDKNRGYFSGRYENSKLGVNASVNVNTNASILESLLYQARGRHPLALDLSEIKN